MANKTGLFILLAILCLASSATNARAQDFTLSDSALMCLDWDLRNYLSPDPTTYIAARRDVPGPGVEFDICYPSNDGTDDSLYLISSTAGGSGALTSIDISAYDAFALDFTLISINGSSSGGAGRKLIVGSIINQPGSLYSYRAEVLTFDSPATPNAVSRTTSTAAAITNVGFVANIPSWWYDDPADNPWDPSGSIVTLLIKPVPDAVAIPEPAAFLLLLPGVLYLTRKTSQKYRSTP